VEPVALQNLTKHEGKVTYEERCRLLNQPGLVIWFTGFSGAGKSTIAVELERRLFEQRKAAYRLDGDNIRLGLNSDLGFSEADRSENLRRIAEVGALMKDAGLIVLVSFISPYRQMRDFARARAGPAGFIEVFVKASLETCALRDPKGLYDQAKRGGIKDFTGISAPYEEPLHPEIMIDTDRLTVAESVAVVWKYLTKHRRELGT
jgi:adenylyl-sulfate kinase